MRRRDSLGANPLSRGGEHDPIVHELGKRDVVDMLELASAATRKVAARRSRAMRPRFERAVGQHDVTRRSEGDVPALRRDAIAFRGDALDDLPAGHNARA